MSSSIEKVDMLSGVFHDFGAVLTTTLLQIKTTNLEVVSHLVSGPLHKRAHTTGPDAVINYPKLYIHPLKKKKKEIKLKGKRKRKKIVHYRGHFWC